MNQSHDPRRHIAYLEQCLSNDKRPLAFLLGAGCPSAVKSETGESLISDIASMTEEVRQQLRNSNELSPLSEIIERHFVEDGCTDVNIEQILSHIRDLHRVAGNCKVRGLTANDLSQLDKSICSIVTNLVDKALLSDSTPYHAIALWVDAVQREYPVEFFTTNYDVLLEQALEDRRVAYFDGFLGVNRPFFDVRAIEEDSLPPRWARVWKLHGSLNWYQDSNGGIFRGFRNETSQQRVIHPSHLKYEESRRMPYLAMVDRLRAFFKQPSSVLVVTGYSFRDQHLNEIIIQGLSGTQSAVVFALLFDCLEDYPIAVSLAKRRPNFSILAKDGGVIGGNGAPWIKLEAEHLESNHTPWLSWDSSASSNEESKLAPQLKLGDFVVLGQLLHSLVESTSSMQEVERAP